MEAGDKNKRIFLTGATGLVGAHVLKLLLARGYTQITALKRPTSRMDLVSDVVNRVNWVEGDLLDLDALSTGMDRADWVIHTAALISQDRKRAAEMYRVNAKGTANVVNCAIEQGLRKMLHVSSISVFTRTGGSQQINELTEWQRTRYTSEYGYSKYVAEMEVWRGRAEGLEIAIINPSIVLGAGFWNEGSSAIFSRLWNGLKMYPTGINGYVDVRDVAYMTVLRLEKDLGPERMIVSAVNLSFQDLFTQIAQEFERPAPAIRISAFLSEMTWRLLKPVEWLTGKQPMITRETARTTQCLLHFDNTRSLTVPGFTYTPIEQTLGDITAVIKRTADKKFVPATLPFLPGHLA